MVVLLELADLSTIETLLVAIPESLGVLIFGVVFVLTAVLIRKVLRRTDPAESNEKIAK